jgi:hypothetical protein
MPYLPRQERIELDSLIPELVDVVLAGGTNPASNMNYLIAKISDEIVMRRGERYGLYNSLIGALECSKLEMYRRMIAPYEDEQIISHGDVYNIALHPDQTTLEQF